MTYVFNSPFAPGSELWCEGVAKGIYEQVEADSVREYAEDEKRWHLGASEIGHPCSRKIWYSFRWFTDVIHTGRMHRLFQRGHREEDQFVHRLRRIGLTVWDRDPHSTPDPVTGELKQFRVAHPLNAHYGGSLDAIAYVPWLPVNYQYVIGEFKTHSDSSFKKVTKEGVRKSKPEHYGQMSTYGHKKNLFFGLYCAVNKNDDDLSFQVVPLKHELADVLDTKALAIIDARKPPTRYSENSANVVCKFCDHRGVCHLSQPVARNCRSCKFSIATPEGEWYCEGYSTVLDRKFVPIGCGYWTPAL